MTRMSPPDDRPFSGLRAICIAQNVPGPQAAALLAEQGMAVIKVEPPGGDMTAQIMPGWYADLNRAASVETLNLRDPGERARFDDLLRAADLLISSQRRGAMTRLGITPPALAALNPDLCWVEIVGDTEAPDIPGHDLTYQAEVGLLDPSGVMPRSLIADLGGAEAAAGAAATLLLGRARGKPGRHAAIGLKQAAERLAAAARHGATVNGGLLSGALPEYAIHALRDGRVACAALEGHFAARLTEIAGADIPGFFAGLTADQVRALAREHDLPLKVIPAD